MTLTQVMTYADLVIDEANNMIEHTVGVIFGNFQSHPIPHLGIVNILMKEGGLRSPRFILLDMLRLNNM